MIKHKAKPTEGFTLIEVLLGIVIFSIIALTLYNVFWMGIKIDNRSEGINKNYQEARLAFEVLSQDLENAILYDFSASYPQEISFKGQADQFSFLLPNEDGVEKVRYYLGMPDWEKITRVIIKQHMNHLSHITLTSNEDAPIRFLMRQEVLLSTDLSKGKNTSLGEVIAAGIKKDSLRFQYGFIKQDASSPNPTHKEIIWKDTWEDVTLPLAVRVEMTLFDIDNPEGGEVLQRDIYLAPVDWGQKS